MLYSKNCSDSSALNFSTRDVKCLLRWQSTWKRENLSCAYMFAANATRPRGDLAESR